MNLDYLRTFLVVCEKGSFSRAARTLCISQTTVSFQVKSLERECGVTLFTRSAAGVELTAAGRVLREYAEKIESLAHEASERLHRVAGGRRATVHIGASPVSGAYMLPYVIGAFSERFPHTAIELEIRSGPTVSSLLREGRLEVAVLEPCVRSAGFNYRFLNRDRILLAAAPGAFVDGRRATLELDEVRMLPFVFREDECCTRLAVKESLARVGFRLEHLNIVMTVTDIEALKNVVKRGDAVTFLSEWALYDDLQSGELVAYEVPKLRLVRDRFVVTSQTTPVCEAAARFVEFLVSPEMRDVLNDPASLRKHLARAPR